jgi:hypothetical protein
MALLRRRPKSTVSARDMTRARVLFTASDREVDRIDVEVGPCVPAPARKKPLVSVHRQWSDTPAQFCALFAVLGGDPSRAWTELRRGHSSLLVKISDAFAHDLARMSMRALQADAEARLDEVKSVAERWLRAADWPPDQLARGLESRLVPDMGWARLAAEKGQSLYCWFGPAVPEYVIGSGTLDDLPAYMASKRKGR